MGHSRLAGYSLAFDGHCFVAGTSLRLHRKARLPPQTGPASDVCVAKGFVDFYDARYFCRAPLDWLGGRTFVCLVGEIDVVECVREGRNQVRRPSQDRLDAQSDRRLFVGSHRLFAVGFRHDRSTGI